METDFSRYPLRVTKGEDGVYRWSAPMNKVRIRKILAVMLRFLCPFTLFFTAFVFFTQQNAPHNGKTALLLLAVFVMIDGFALGMWWLFPMKRGKAFLQFEMDESHVREIVETEFGNAQIKYVRIRRIVADPETGMILVKGTLSSVQLFLPPEDFELVLRFIQEKTRNPADVIQL